MIQQSQDTLCSQAFVRHLVLKGCDSVIYEYIIIVDKIQETVETPILNRMPTAISLLQSELAIL